MLLQTLNQTLPEKLKVSLLKLSFLIILVKSKTDIPQFWIATLLTLLLNSKKLPKKLIEELVKNSKLPLNSLNQEILV